MCDVRNANAASSTYKPRVIKVKNGTTGLHHKAAKRTEH